MSVPSGTTDEWQDKQGDGTTGGISANQMLQMWALEQATNTRPSTMDEGDDFGTSSDPFGMHGITRCSTHSLDFPLVAPTSPGHVNRKTNLREGNRQADEYTNTGTPSAGYMAPSSQSQSTFGNAAGTPVSASIPLPLVHAGINEFGSLVPIPMPQTIDDITQANYHVQIPSSQGQLILSSLSDIILSKHGHGQSIQKRDAELQLDDDSIRKGRGLSNLHMTGHEQVSVPPRRMGGIETSQAVYPADALNNVPIRNPYIPGTNPTHGESQSNQSNQGTLPLFIVQHKYHATNQQEQTLSPAVPAAAQDMGTCSIDTSSLERAMDQSIMSQKLLQDWDKNMGLKRSHSKTMRDSTESRKQVQRMIVQDVIARYYKLAHKGGGH